MVTVDSIFTDTIEVKQSKFIAFLMPMTLYESEMKQLREKHPKAVHFVSAYRMLNEYDQVVEYSGDDGEPKGTSGKPTLSVLQGHELINAAIITVRYFGGTKLGPGGLVRAYAQAANAAFATALLITYEKHFRHIIACEYTNISIVEYEALQHKVHIVSKTFDEQGALLVIEAAYADMESFLTGVGRCVNTIE